MSKKNNNSWILERRQDDPQLSNDDQIYLLMRLFTCLLILGLVPMFIGSIIAGYGNGLLGFIVAFVPLLVIVLLTLNLKNEFKNIFSYVSHKKIYTILVFVVLTNFVFFVFVADVLPAIMANL